MNDRIFMHSVIMRIETDVVMVDFKAVPKHSPVLRKCPSQDTLQLCQNTQLLGKTCSVITQYFILY